MNRQSQHAGLTPHYDVLIIGGGINGCGIARDAVGRGFSVCLCEAGDFGGGTSSASTKLVHGGLRYLEHYEFLLVRKALMEREVLWKMAPHIIWPMRFVLPHHAGLRPAWLLRLGLFLYDHIGGRKLLPPTTSVNLAHDEVGKPLKPAFSKAFEYSDCWVEDSRLVVLNALDAADRGANMQPRTKVVHAQRVDGQWRVEMEDTSNGHRETVTAGIIVNAAGPWVDKVLKQVFGYNDARNVRLVRGSHIVIARKFAHDKAYIFQNDDNRIIFAIPYEGDYTLIGTTDAEHGDDMDKPEISAEEIGYLCDMASEYFSEPVTRSDVVWTYSGVRPLYDDGASKAQEATRDYVIRTDGDNDTGLLLNIFGGKITTFRVLAEQILKKIEDALGTRDPAWTADAALPGGDFAVQGFDALVDEYVAARPLLDRKLITRLVRQYGTRALMVLGDAQKSDDLGKEFGIGLHEAEVLYLMRHEWAATAQDVLFRRTKLGIAYERKQIQALQEFMDRAAKTMHTTTSQTAVR
ncbi:glycerol-3-phosphate dehydrogenase [Anderseniella sp. Alg231-50]|uniref:glycerol-3-phosphate dehydrogenase n=1 Tax=Anderseniella sp. Alg231-50 TaxID=1922226 RepID=UPI000D54BE4C